MFFILYKILEVDGRKTNTHNVIKILEETNNCKVLGIDLSRLVLNPDGSRKCFSGQLIYDNQIFRSYNYYFEIPLAGCGIPSKACSQLGSNILHFSRSRNFGDYDQSSWILNYNNKKTSLEVTFSSNDICAFDKSRILNRIVFVCDVTANGVEIRSAGVFNLCSYDFLIPITNENLCSTSLTPILTPT